MEPTVTVPRPYASNDRVNALNRPQPILRTAKDGTSPFTTIDRRLLKDKSLNATLRGIMVNLLDHADSWEFVNIAKDIAADAQCSEKTAYRYLNQLIELGYVHKISCKGGGRFDKYATAHRYKVSELPLRAENPADIREWEYCGGTQVTRFRENGFPPDYKTKHYGTIRSDVTVEQMMPKKGRASNAKRVGKFYQTNRRERDVLHSSEHQVPLTPFRGINSSNDFRVDGDRLAEAQPGTQLLELPEMPAKNSKSSAPKKSSAPRHKAAKKYPTHADFNSTRRPVVSSVPLPEFMANFATAYPAAVKALEDSGRSGTTKWAEAVLSNPLMAMIQELLGQSRLDYRDLVFHSRRLKRATFKPWELSVLWCAKRAGVAPGLMEDAVSVLGRRDFRTAVDCSRWKIAWDENLRIIRNMLSDTMMHPLVEFAGRMFALNQENPCSNVFDEFTDVRERALLWISTPGVSSRFFESRGADTWFERALVTHPEFWAASKHLLRDPGLPEGIREKLLANAAATPEAAVREWVGGLLEFVPCVPGGLSLTTVEILTRGRGAAPDAMYTPVMGAMSAFLPEGSMFDDITHIFNTPTGVDFTADFAD